MQVFKGRRRIVIAFPSLGIVIKFARFRKQLFKEALTVGSLLREYPFRIIPIELRRIARELVSGVKENWGERRFYKHTNMYNRLMLMPTYFSFLGLVNIQKYGMSASETDSEPIYHAFFEIAGEDLIRDGHHWVNGSNFHLAADGPKLLDYGNPQTQRIVNNYGLALYRDFNIEHGRATTERFKSLRRPASS